MTKKKAGAVTVRLLCRYGGDTYRGVGQARTIVQARKLAEKDLRGVLPAECTNPRVREYVSGVRTKSRCGLWSE